MDLGIFTNFWDGRPHHLPFLSLTALPCDETQNCNLQWSISKLEAILQSNPDPTIAEGIRLLLQQDNWRMHLVGAVSMLLIKKATREDLIGLFWERLSKGSWVSPQLLVVLSISDKSFTSKGQIILEQGLKIHYAARSPMDHPWSTAGIPTTISENKIMAVINYLLYDVIEDNDDNNHAGSLAKNWEERLYDLMDANILKHGNF